MPGRSWSRSALPAFASRSPRLMTAESFPFDASSIARADGGSVPSANAPTTSTPARSLSRDVVSRVMSIAILLEEPLRSEERKLEGRDEPDAEPGPSGVFLPDELVDHPKLEAGDRRRAVHPEGVHVASLADGDVLSDGVVGLLKGRPAPVVGEPGFPGLLVV